HTSTATVAVMPEVEEMEVEIDPNDLKIDVYRSTGPGGQSVNTTDSAVRITHVPTGLVVAMQDEKSQLQNKQKALRVLRARLQELERQRQEDELSATRRSQIGRGERAEKIRTYNYPDNRVSDHRVNLTIKRLDRIVEGDLDEFTEALTAEERRRSLDVGVGSGAIALAIADEHPGARVIAIDRSADALALAAENLARSSVNGRVELRRSDLLAGVEGPFDLVVSNPPYVSPSEYDTLQ